MANFIEEYKKLLIWQYQDKPKAQKHIELILSEFEKIYNLLNVIPDAFDLDKAVGKQQDILGKILGISRNAPFAVSKKFFGFTNNINSYSFDKRLKTTGFKIPFKKKFEDIYTSGRLDDNQYRIFLKAKAIKNNVRATMIDDNKLSMQDAINFLFNDASYMIDNQDMAMTIYIDNSYGIHLLKYIKQLDLLPRPQGVELGTFLHFSSGNAFGFTRNKESLGFSRRLDGGIKPKFTKKIFI